MQADIPSPRVGGTKEGGGVTGAAWDLGPPSGSIIDQTYEVGRHVSLSSIWRKEN